MDNVLILRPWRLADASALARWASDPRCTEPANWPAVPDPAAARRLIARHFLLRGDVWALCDGADTPIGAVALRPWGRERELSYILAPSHWGRGIVPAACAAVLRAAAQAGLDHAVLRIAEENAPSRRVAEKLGFAPRADGLWVKTLG